MDSYSLITRIGRIYGNVSSRLPSGYAPPPLFLVLELTYRCNLACAFCYLRREEGSKEGRSRRTELTVAEIQHIVDQIPPWTLVLLSGGEVLLRDDLPEVLRIIARKRRCHIFTNGTLITPVTATLLVNLGITSVGISVDGPEEVHDTLRGRETFARAATAIRILAESKSRLNKKYPLINLKTTITADNVACLSESIHIAEESGAEYCTFQVLNSTTRLSGLSLQESLDYRHSPPPIANFPLTILDSQLRRIRELASGSRLRVRILPDLPASSILAHYANCLELSEHLCVSPWTVMYISPAGEVFPCLNYRVGSVREQPLRKLWNNERYRQFRRSLQQDGLFPECCGCCDLIPKGTR